MPDVTEFVIDRSKWLRGGGGGESSLLRTRDGKMCCLGLYLEACGLPKEELEDINEPGELMLEAKKKAPLWLLDLGPSDNPFIGDEEDTSSSSLEAEDLMNLNDEKDVEAFGSEEGREERIAKAFLEQGIKVTFVDGPVEKMA